MRTFIVDFDTRGGGWTGDTKQKYLFYKGNFVPEPTDPTRYNYTFVGCYSDKQLTHKWDFAKNTVETNTTLFAKWIPHEFTVIYEFNNGEESKSINVPFETLLQQPEKPSKFGYVFLGWYSDEQLTTKWDFETDTMPESLTLYAKWDMVKGSLPIIEINTVNNAQINDKENWINASYSITNCEKDFEIDNKALTIKGRGNSSWTMPKKCYSIKLDKKQNLFGIATDKHRQYALISNYSDKTLIRNELAYYWGNNVFTNMDWTPHTQQVVLYLNGEYLGIYLLVERIKINEALVDIEEISSTNPEGGWIVEVDARLDADYYWYTNHGIPICLKEPDDYTNYGTIKTYINNVEAILYDEVTGTDWLDPEEGWRKYLNEDSFIDWYLANEVVKNNDASWNTSVYMYFDNTDSKMHMGPIWDFDLAFGNVFYTEASNYEGFWINNSGWHNRLFEDPEFVTNVKNRWSIVKSELQVDSTINKLSQEIKNDTNLNFSKWNILGRYVWPNPSGYDQRKTYQSEVDFLYYWISQRINWLDEAINNL